MKAKIIFSVLGCSLYAPPIKPHRACPCGVLLCGKSGRTRTVRRAKEELALIDSFSLQTQRKLN